MAVNYSIGQAFDVIAKGEDVEAIADIARRFPMVAIHCAKLTGVAEVAGPLLGAIPAYVSARKVEKAFKAGASDDVEDVEETEAEPEEEAEKRKERSTFFRFCIQFPTPPLSIQGSSD